MGGLGMETLFLTRGFEQQFDYNVYEYVKPWGAALHGRVSRLQAETTATSDFEFSFVLRGEGGSWEMILNSLPSKRKDFARSPLRTYLYVSGNSSEAGFALALLQTALADFWPGHEKGADGRICKMLDTIVTPEVVNGIGGWRNAEKIDAAKWSSEILIPALQGVAAGGATGLPGQGIKEFLLSADKVLHGESRLLTGEYSPFLDDPMKDEPNLTLHFSGSDARRILPNGSERRKSPNPTVGLPEPGKKKGQEQQPARPMLKNPMLIGVIAILTVLAVAVRGCRKTMSSQLAPQSESVLSTNAPASSATP